MDDAIRAVRALTDEELAQLAGALAKADTDVAFTKALVVNELERRLGVVLS